MGDARRIALNGHHGLTFELCFNVFHDALFTEREDLFSEHAHLRATNRLRGFNQSKTRCNVEFVIKTACVKVVGILDPLVVVFDVFTVLQTH